MADGTEQFAEEVTSILNSDVANKAFSNISKISDAVDISNLSNSSKSAGFETFSKVLTSDALPKSKSAIISELAKNMDIPEDRLKFLANGSFSDEDAEMMKIQLEINEKRNQLSADAEYYERYLKEESKDEGIMAKIRQYPIDMRKSLDRLNANMWETLVDGINFQPVDIFEVALNLLVEQFTEALQPFLEVPNMPEIPLLGDLKNFLQTLSRMGQVEKMISKNLTPSQKKAWEAKKQQDNKEPLCKKIRSQLGELVKELKETFDSIIRLIPSMINFFWLALLNELIQLLKPVFDAFGIVAGTYMKLLSSVPEFLTSSWKLAETLGYRLLKIAYAKLEGIFNIFYLIGDVPGNIEDQQKIVENDMAKCKYEIDQLTLQCQSLPSRKIKKMANKEIERLDKQISKAKTETDKKILEDAKQSMVEIEKGMDNSISDYAKDLRNLRIKGLAEYKYQNHMIDPVEMYKKENKEYAYDLFGMGLEFDISQDSTIGQLANTTIGQTIAENLVIS